MYYLLEQDSFQKPTPYRTRYEPPEFRLKASKWICGTLMKLDQKPLMFELWANKGEGLAEIFLDTVPLFREDVIDSLIEIGVDNLETCPAILKDPNKEKFILKNYQAVNIIGTIRGADLENSDYSDKTGTGLIATGFRKLIIDEKKTYGSLFFRLAEALSSIIVHQKVKEHIESKKFRYLQFRPLFE